jgi:hypothetical protein
MGRLAHLLHTTGFEPAEHPVPGGGQRAWRVAHAPNPRSAGDLPWEFVGEVAWPPAMRRAIAEYAALHSRVREAFDHIDEASSKRKRREATELWDRL